MPTQRTHIASRRALLRAAAAGAATMALPGALSAQHDGLSASRLRAKLALIRSDGANVVAMPSANGTIAVDGGIGESSGLMHDALARLSDTSRVEVLFNTNWRPEHTGLNDRLGAGDTRIVAHEYTKLWLENDFTVDWESRRYRPRAAAALPTETFFTQGKLSVADETIEYGYLPQAHTDCDIYVFFRDSNVLAVSDLLAVDAFPVLDYSTGGWIGGYLRATESLLRLANEDTVIVPAHGAPQNRSSLESQRELCAAILDAVNDAYARAWSFDEFAAKNPAASFVAARGDATQFLELTWRGAWFHIREMPHKIF